MNYEFRIIFANPVTYMLISRPLVTPKTFKHTSRTANITENYYQFQYRTSKYVYDDVGRVFST